MSNVFADLCAKARALGAERIRWEVDLDRFANGPGHGVGLDDAWVCYIVVPHVKQVREYGRSGEEAVRVAVDTLERWTNEEKKEKEERDAAAVREK